MSSVPRGYGPHILIGPSPADGPDDGSWPTCNRCAIRVPPADGGLILQEAIYAPDEPDMGVYLHRICDDCAEEFAPVQLTLHVFYRQSAEAPQ